MVMSFLDSRSMLAVMAGCLLVRASAIERAAVNLSDEASGASAAISTAKPHLIPLRRETVPVRRKGRVVSYKTSYSGLINVGEPAQEFRVVFDTGSGHVILPAVECESEACLAHRRYNMTASASATAINVDGSPVQDDELCDQVNIGFGTGEVAGEFVKERVCLGPAGAPPGDAGGGPGDAGGGPAAAPCIDGVHVVTAVEMSAQPFKSFGFDGILGLGLEGLSLSQNFSFFNWLSASDRVGAAQFAAFLTDGEEGEASEIAFGGHNVARTLEPLSWAPVVLPEHGHWAVQILAVRVDGVTLDICRDGTCRGVVDTGTSHLGIPAPHDKEVEALLTRRAEGAADCRLVDAPVLELEVPGRNLTLLPGNYMRRLPLRGDVRLGATGVTLKRGGAGAGASAAARPPSAAAAAAALRSERRLRAAAGPAAQADAAEQYCRPRLLPVDLPAPLGPKVFILGEPVLHRYYTVFDWGKRRLGFGLAASRRNAPGPHGVGGTGP